MKSDEFIREVDEAVRQDRWLSLWKQYRVYVTGAAVALIVGSTGGYAWREWTEARQTALARAYLAAGETAASGNFEQAAVQFRDLADDAGSDIAALARLQAVGALNQAEDAVSRDEVLANLIEDDPDRLLADLGQLIATQSDLDRGDPGAAAETVAGLVDDGDPWRFSALEVQALARIDLGDEAGAAELLQAIVDDPAAPSSLSRRAAELLSSLGA